MKINFHGPVTNSEIIRKSIVDLHSLKIGLADSDIQTSRITVTPTDSATLGLPDSDFGFTTTIETFVDGKKYNKTTDTDE